MVTDDGLFRDSNARIAAIISMRLLVVANSPPEISFSRRPERRMAPQPPGPGFPEQAPSVKISTCGRFAMRDSGDQRAGNVELDVLAGHRDFLDTDRVARLERRDHIVDQDL